MQTHILICSFILLLHIDVNLMKSLFLTCHNNTTSQRFFILLLAVSFSHGRLLSCEVVFVLRAVADTPSPWKDTKATDQKFPTPVGFFCLFQVCLSSSLVIFLKAQIPTIAILAVERWPVEKLKSELKLHGGGYTCCLGIELGRMFWKDFFQHSYTSALHKHKAQKITEIVVFFISSASAQLQ